MIANTDDVDGRIQEAINTARWIGFNLSQKKYNKESIQSALNSLAWEMTWTPQHLKQDLLNEVIPVIIESGLYTDAVIEDTIKTVLGNDNYPNRKSENARKKQKMVSEEDASKYEYEYKYVFHDTNEY